MSQQDERVRSMARTGTISQEDANRLLAALHGSRRARPPGCRLWLQPMDALSPRAAAITAAAVTLASLMVARLGVRFDGALDLHRIGGTPPWPIALFDVANAVLLTGIVLWASVRPFVAQVRLVDFLLTVALARIAQVCAGFVAVIVIPNPDAMTRAIIDAASSGRPLDTGIVVGGVVLLPFFAWFLALLFFGFKTSSGLTPSRATVVFAAGLVAAEVVTKVALAGFVRGILATAA